MTSASFDRLIGAVSPIAGEHDELRTHVRKFLKECRAADRFTPRCDNWHVGFDRAFSKELAARGWVGMTIPREYGGHGRSAVERLVVVEELIAAGAPLAAHWVGDRQIGPALLKHGNESLKHRYLPLIAKVQTAFALGMSEPDAGSDLANVRTRARKSNGGWVINGSKVWTSHAHRSDVVVVLARSADAGQDRHDGLSQFFVAVDSPGLMVRPIETMAGDAHFAEIFFDDVFVESSDVLGNEGAGWSQIVAELAFERSGPERFLSTFPLVFAWLVEWVGRAHPRQDSRAGLRLLAEINAMRALAYATAREIDAGQTPVASASVLKDVGTTLESESVFELATHDLAFGESADLRALRIDATALSPAFTLRGGTNEVLRSVLVGEMFA